MNSIFPSYVHFMRNRYVFTAQLLIRLLKYFTLFNSQRISWCCFIFWEGGHRSQTSAQKPVILI